jgi:methyl acetate hydrolase
MKSIVRQSIASILFAILVWGCGQSKPVAQTPKPITNLEQALEKAFHESGLSSVALGYVTNRGVIFTTCFGTISQTENTPLTENSIFRIASMTKAITSVAVLQLAEKGLLNLDDFAGDFLPEIDQIPILAPDGSLSAAEDRPTIKNLLTHTSGFSYNLFDPRLRNFEKPADWQHGDYPKVFEASQGWIYGTGIDWAGRIVETITGLTLEEYFRQHITGPLEMHNTWFNVPEEQHKLIMSLIMRQDDGTFVENPRRTPQKVAEFNGGGGLFSSLNDYLKFLQMILNKGNLNGTRILGEDWVDLLFADLLPELLQPETLPKGMGHSPAWAIQLSDNDFGRKAGSAYWSGYLNTYYSIDRNTGIATVVMTNVMPFMDPAPLGIYKLFESLVRKSD